MPFLIENIDGEAHQRHTVLFEESEITLELRYHATVEMWAVNVSYKDRQVFGLKLSVGVLHMRSQNLPFDLVVGDNSGQGLDPIRRDDFESGRCSLYLLDSADMETIRGAPVPI